ncbi:MAG: 3-dehydroquinate synthase [Clostridiales bacterium]|nr:3-dehydroquinate synthase [Clostridiales bacterium]
MELITIKTPSTKGEIYIGKEAISKRLPCLTAGQKNFVLTDSNVYALYEDWFDAHFPQTEIFILPAGEENKNFQSLYAILEKMAGAGMRRTSRLFAVGGGVIGDIGGLAAALYMRGISYVQIPTTLLAQVDSSVGGKTAVDLGGIKNVVGAFYQPCEVLMDSTFLKTLPDKEIKCGLGEIVKYAALNGEIFDLLENRADDWKGLTFLESLITACVSHKARVVEMDEKESGERRSLNVGHTTGHAIELTSGLSHGESVLYGMLLETRMVMQAGVCEKTYGQRLLALVERAIALEPTAGMDFTAIEDSAEKARADKKNTDDDKIRMAVAKAKGQWTDFSLPFAEYVTALKNACK